jgi:hypothetical protein
LRIPGKIFVFPNDKRQILNDKFSIQTLRFGGASSAFPLPPCAFSI